jgi:glycosyltransferase involved in cell wall biosynthesis
MLSFCTIVKNECANLARCLESVKPHVDEMVIVDTGSTDDTVAIAQKYGAKIHHFKWCDDFAAARNYACSLVSEDWILVLDADEELIVQDCQWLANLYSAPTTTIAYALLLSEAANDATPLTTIRLFRNHPEIQYSGRYHESLYYRQNLLSANEHLFVALSTPTILHYGYESGLLSQKAIVRIPILENIRQAEGLNFMTLWTLAGLYETVGDVEQFESCYAEGFEQLLPYILEDILPEDQRVLRYWLYGLGIKFLESGDFETARLICQRGISWFPDFPPLYYLTGWLLRMLGFSQGAIAYFESCLESYQHNQYFKGEPFDPQILTVLPANQIGICYRDLKNREKAIAAFELALSFDPNHIESQHNLAAARALLPQQQSISSK